MADYNQISSFEKDMKACNTSMEDPENPNGKSANECGRCKKEVEGKRKEATNRSPQGRREIPPNQERKQCHLTQNEPVVSTEQSQEEAQISGANQQVSSQKRLEELIKLKAHVETRLQTLRSRAQVLHSTSNRLKEEVSAQYEEIRKKLQKDELETIELMEEDSRVAMGKLNKAIKEENQHLDQIRRLIKSIQTEPERKCGMTNKQEDKSHEHSEFNKKICGVEQFDMNTAKFQKLLKILQNISKNLQAKLTQKFLLLDLTPVLLDTTTSNKNIFISSDQASMCLVSEPRNIPNSPLRFDSIHSVLASSGWLRGKHYWEVDVLTSPAWSIGMAYGSIERKGNQKSVKLGRNRLSWCVELKDSRLLAWHNDKAVVCAKGNSSMKQVGVHVDCERSRIVFYNADSMQVLQEFSSSTAAFFDRLQHRFSEAVFPAFRLFPPKAGPITFEKLQVCKSSV
ncbi:nuclear factor 7, ovary-like isoform X2 [Ambystoma mexicanum]|uniref:nuclear factor 7, ovary-like isoform X2 n=1 Tax=Ambystoma mexicanum TaxID=8296 RepID=UPI0037E80C12